MSSPGSSVSASTPSTQDLQRSSKQPQPVHSQDDEDSSKQDVEFLLIAKTDNARVVSNVLSALHISNKKEGQFAHVTITKSGLKFLVEESKSFQGTAFLQKELFHEYEVHLRDEENGERFRIHFSYFMECLNIYGASNNYVSLQLAYGGYGDSWMALLEENGVVTTCALKTLESENVTVLPFRSSSIPNKVIMEAEFLKEAFNELDWSSSDVTVLMSPDEPHFRLSTTGPSGSCQVDYPKDSEVFESFDCTETQIYTYKLSHMLPAVKALSLSRKAQLRINKEGILSLQHMIEAAEGANKKHCFVDFFILPKEEDDDDTSR